MNPKYHSSRRSMPDDLSSLLVEKLPRGARGYIGDIGIGKRQDLGSGGEAFVL